MIQQVTDKGPGIHILTGPIYVEEAQPGDVLEVRIQDVKLAVPYAYNAFMPGHGALSNDFPYARCASCRWTSSAWWGCSRPASRCRCGPFSAAWASPRPTYRAAQLLPALDKRRQHGVAL
ncbi:hypothetical protein DDQ68_21905 [Hymenobacter nivis]|uniref:Acetamidase n=1 Tax=Hymenobacter nivis TaxID=1850093 RepID=A0A2Z3GUQ7_9BACT|nr:hypothetical protein DDQ68_21905 [Hymenobacter nivis]